MLEFILKRFDNPDETTTFKKGKFETVTLGGMTIGRATYQPGWRWSEDVGPKVGEPYCTVEHVGMVISGCATALAGSLNEPLRITQRASTSRLSRSSVSS